MPRRIRIGMVGGGEGAFIGAVHRWAARLDGHYELVAGALSSTEDKSRRSAAALGIAEERAYSSFAEMARAESQRTDGIEAVVIVTPNHLHAPAATAFLEAGIHVICDKPVTTTVADARLLQELARRKGLLFAVTHNYTGYAMVRHARQMIREGALGDIRVVQVEYAQDWLAEPIEQAGHKQAGWRTDPTLAGGGSIGDIGSHAWQIADYVTGIAVEELCAELTSFVPGRVVDDNAQVMLRYANGARGALWCSQVASGRMNDLRLRIYGAKGGIEWCQEQPDSLRWTPLGQPTQLLQRGTPAANAAAARVTRVPGGHPEGYIGAFATVYSEIAHRLRGDAGAAEADFPTIADGVRGVEFIDAVQQSARHGGQWVRLDKDNPQ